MKSRAKKFLSVLLSMSLAISTFSVVNAFAAQSDTLHSSSDTVSLNPTIWSDIPDMDVIRVGDAYYMTSTTMHLSPGCPIMKSKDLVHWKIVNYVYDILNNEDSSALKNDKNIYGQGEWASSLKYHDDTYYIEFGCNNTGKTYIYQTKDIENGPWTKSVLDTLYHDASLFFDDDGKVYLVYGAGDIYAIELTSDATAIKEGAKGKKILDNPGKIAQSASNPKDIVSSEGTHVQKINGKYYIFNISWPNDGVRTETVYRSDSFWGTYEGKVVYEQSSKDGFSGGIAQGQLVDTPDGKWYAMMFQDHGAVGRVPYLLPVTWKDGWPQISTNNKGLQMNLDGTNGIVSSDEFYNSDEKNTGISHLQDESKIDESEDDSSDSSSDGITKELITNGDFEDGTKSWTGNDGATIDTTEDVHSGDTGFSCYVSGRTKTGSGPKQNVNIEVGKTYTFTAEVMYKGDNAPESKDFHICVNSGMGWGGDSKAENPICVVASASVEKGKWTKITGTYAYNYSNEVKDPFIFLETPYSSSPDKDKDLFDFYVDDASVTTQTNELIANGDFEDGIEPWTGNDGAAVDTTEDVHSGDSGSSCYVSERTKTGSGPKQNVNIKVGKTYTFTAEVMYKGDNAPESKDFHICVNSGMGWGGDSKAENPICVVASASVEKGKWTKITGTYAYNYSNEVKDPFIFLETPYSSSPDKDKDLFDFYVDNVSVEVKGGSPSHSNATEEGTNDYNGSNLGLDWQWNHNPDNNYWSLTDHPGYLRLTTNRVVDGLLSAPNTLTQRTFGPVCSGTVAVDISHMKDGDYAGLAAFQQKYGFIGVNMSGGSKKIIMMRNADSKNDSGKIIESADITSDQNTVYLKEDFNFNSGKDEATFYYSLDGKTWAQLGDTLKMEYTMPHFMGYRFALCNYSTKSIGGYVDFDYFRVNNEINGTTPATSNLTANLGSVKSIVGVKNMTFNMPITMDTLPDGKYTSINASLNIPADLMVSDVKFNSSNVTGSVNFAFSNNQLVLSVSGDNVDFKDTDKTKVFATIKFKVNNYVTQTTTKTIKIDYIEALNNTSPVNYNVSKAVSSVELTYLDTGAVAKKPGYSNPLMDYKYGADPWALVYNGRVYVYMSSDSLEYDGNNKIVDNNYSNIKSISVISSSDMVNWRDDGEIPVAAKPTTSNGQTYSGATNAPAKWASNSWAPSIVYKKINGKDKFFLYFADNASGIGVLTSDSPTGPFIDPIGKPIVSHSTDGTQGVVWMFDPAAIVDDDGTGYLYLGGGVPSGQADHPNSIRVIKLGDDMISTVGSAEAIDAPHVFEDSGISKYNGKYYYSYCTNFTQTSDGIPTGTIAYMMSDSPKKNFSYAGTFLPNPSTFFGVGGNNHHAVFEFNDQWYVVYHAQTLQKALGQSHGYRSPHINKIAYYENGKIKPVTGDMKGISQIKNLDPYQRQEAETIAWQKGISTSDCSVSPAAGLTVNRKVVASDGDWIAVSNADFGTNGAQSFSVNVASESDGTIELHLDQPQGQLAGTLKIDPTGGNDKWKLLSCNVQNISGIHDIYFVVKGNQENTVNMDYWQFKAKSGESGVTGKVVSNFETIKASVKDQTVYIGTNISSLNLPNSLNATVDGKKAIINGVKWISSPNYSANVAGTYKFIAKLPTEYAVADGVNIPIISVTVKHKNSGNSSNSHSNNSKNNNKTTNTSDSNQQITPAKNNHFKSDTAGTYSFSSNSTYYYKIITTDTYVPSAVSSNPSIVSVELAKKLPDGYLFKVTNVGVGSATITTIAGDGTKTAFTVQGTGVSGGIISDTPNQHSITLGKTYQFKFTVHEEKGNPTFTTGSNKVLKNVSMNKVGNDYYYKIQSASKGSVGVYVTIPGKAPIRECVVTVS